MRLFILFTLTLIISVNASLACMVDPAEDSCIGYYYPKSEISTELLDDKRTGSDNLRLLIKKFYKREVLSVSEPINEDQYLVKVSNILKSKNKTMPSLEYFSLYPQGSSHYQTNNYQTVLDFLERIAVNEKLEDIMVELLKIRHDLLCMNTYHRQPDERILERIIALKKHNDADDYAIYLEAIYYFYSNNFEQALKLFTVLSENSANEWFKETSFYLIARTLMVASQEKWSGSSYDKEKVNFELLDQAEKAFQVYLNFYPDGIYSFSVRNIKRRFLFLRNEYRRMDEEILKYFEKELEKKNFDHTLRGVISEVDMFYGRHKGGVAVFPFYSPLVATTILYRKNIKIPENAIAELERVKEKYESYKNLYDLALFRIKYLRGEFEDIINNPDLKQVPPASPLWAEINILLARSFEAQNRFDEAEAIWLALMKSDSAKRYAEIALADNYLSAKKIFKIFSKTSQVKNKLIWDTTLRIIASDGELSEIADSPSINPTAQNMARDILLKRNLFSGDPVGFVKNYFRFGRPKYFEGVITAAKTLSKDRKDPKALLNYGYFIQTKLAMGFYSLCREYPKTFIQKHASRLPAVTAGDIASPLEYYMNALKFVNPKKDGELEAKILYHAIQCFRNMPRGRWNCVWGKAKEIAKKEVRAKWFNRLKTKYGDNKWAKKTKYYW